MQRSRTLDDREGVRRRLPEEGRVNMRQRGRALRKRYGRAGNGDVTPVVFRVWPKAKGGDVIALFPALPSTGNPYECESYMHVGQHGAADCMGVIHDTRAAKPEEYAALKHELESEPYNYHLKIYARVPRAMNEKRIREVRGHA